MLLGAGTALSLGIAARFFTALTAPAVATPPKQAADAPLAEVPAQSITPGNNSFRWREIWTVAAPDLQDVSITPNGDSLTWVDDAGCVRRILSLSGRTIWRTATPLNGVNHVVAAPDGTVAAYSALNPANGTVVLLNARYGDKHSRSCSVSGAIWSAAFDRSSGMWLGSGERGIYDGRSSGSAPRFKTDGLPESLAASASRIAGYLATRGSKKLLHKPPRFEHPLLGTGRDRTRSYLSCPDIR